jgi:hypothetical protein
LAAAEAPAKGKAKAEKADGESGTKSARSRKA